MDEVKTGTIVQWYEILEEQIEIIRQAYFLNRHFYLSYSDCRCSE